MSNSLLLAVDLGTSFIKAGIYDEQGSCKASATHPVEEECLGRGVYIQYAEQIFNSVVDCIRTAIDALGGPGGEIEAIAFTGQMAGFMGVDKDWNDVTAWSCSLDNRYLPFTDRMLQEHKTRILEDSGTNCPVMAPKIQWFAHDFPEEAKRIRKYIMISGYVLGRFGKLPIEEAVIDRSYLEWTGLADIRRGTWSQPLLKYLGVREDTLPRIVDSTAVCGRLSAETARILGLTSGIPLVSGAGDKPAGCLGAAVVDPGDTILEAASYGGMSCCVKEYRPDYVNHRLESIPSAIPDDFYSHYYIAGSGVTLDWFVDNFAGSLPGDSHGKFREIERRAGKLSPGSEGLRAIGMLGGCAMPLDPSMRGLWAGFDWSHRPEHFFRALLECYCYEFSITSDAFAALYPEYKKPPIRIIGGGSKSPFWVQMFADVFGRPFETLSRSDVALWGACVLAGKAIGLFSDLKETARAHVSGIKIYQPDPGVHARYRELIQEYQMLLERSHGIFHPHET